MVVLVGRGNADLDAGAFEKRRLRELHAAVAEVGDAPSDRVQVRTVMKGTLSWISLSLRFALAMKASPTLFFTGDRRARVARLLSGLWFASDTLVVASMDSLMNALRARRDSLSLGMVN